MNIQLPTDQLKHLGVAAVYLFGSRAEGTAMDGSDFDVGILMNDPRALRDTRVLYQKLYELLTDALDMSGFKNIDIVFLQRSPLELRFDVVQHGKILFEQSFDIRDAFEHTTTMLYADFKPLLNQFDQAVLDRV